MENDSVDPSQFSEEKHNKEDHQAESNLLSILSWMLVGQGKERSPMGIKRLETLSYHLYQAEASKIWRTYIP